MSEPVWINSENFRAITKHLTLEELGAFSTLMWAYWARGGSLPNDDEALFQLLGTGCCTRNQWQQMRNAVVPLLARITEFSTDQDMSFGAH